PKGDLALGVGSDIREGFFEGLIRPARLLKDIKPSQGLFAVDENVEDPFPFVLHRRLREFEADLVFARQHGKAIAEILAGTLVLEKFWVGGAADRPPASVGLASRITYIPGPILAGLVPVGFPVGDDAPMIGSGQGNR